MRSIFGWDYPPGCSGPPDYDVPCDICGEEVDDCICPECPVCGSYGDPDCYINHGMRRTEEQKFSLECNEREWEEEARVEDLYWKNHQDEWED